MAGAAALKSTMTVAPVSTILFSVCLNTLFLLSVAQQRLPKLRRMLEDGDLKAISQTDYLALNRMVDK